MKPICFKRVFGNEFQLTVDFTSHMYSVFAKLRERKLRDRHYAGSVTNRFIKLAAFRFWGCLMGLRRPNAGLLVVSGESAVAGAESTGVQLILQEREPGSNLLWQLEHAKTKALPHSRQKSESAGFLIRRRSSALVAILIWLATLDSKECNNARAGRSTRV